MLDLGAGEILGLGVVALLLLGPNRLPTFASDAAKFLHKVRDLLLMQLLSCATISGRDLKISR